MEVIRQVELFLISAICRK